MMLVRLVALFCLLAHAAGALAARLEIPLRVPFETIRQAFAAQLAASPAGPNVVYREGRCRFLTLEPPALEAPARQLHLIAPGSAALGVELFGNCQYATAWRGSLELTAAPWVDSAGRLRVRIVDSRISDQAGAAIPGLIWDLARLHVHPRLEEFGYDIGGLRAALAAIMRSVAPPEHTVEFEQALAQLQVLEPRVESDHIVVPISIEIPAAWLASPPPPIALAAPLTESELEALDRALQPWDAFLVYSIKQVALDSENSELRKRLFTLLLDSRHRLSAILAGEERAVGDPLRALFVDAWTELRAILAEAQRNGLIDPQLPHYAIFIDAGDALLALDRAAPALGMRLSADGLRQLARSLRPGAGDDPLVYAWSVDPQLRALFDVAEIYELPSAPPAPPLPTKSWLDLFVRHAHAGEDADAATKLDRWVPKRAELSAYELQIGALLQRAGATELKRTALATPYDEVYRHLMPTTALIESCWRQYAIRGGKVTYVRSAASSVGIMQINERVWRGFYDVQRLRWDIAYNTRAGAQILSRYVRDYAIPYAERTGNLEHVPRAAYAVYNAGPRAVGRFNKAEPHPREKRVDDRLWSLYQGISAGARVDLATCDVASAAAAQ